MTDIMNIPLSKLAVWDGNVRKTKNKAFIEELAASIRAHGLQQNLIVRKDGRKFAVVAGGQRLQALNLLARDGAIKVNHLVPCKVIDGDLDATEASLAENVIRADMHPADQFEAFRLLIDKGMPVEDVAGRFGVTAAVVMQRLKLARVSPAVLKAYRAGKLTLEDVMAFAVTDDHEAQDRVLIGMGEPFPVSSLEIAASPQSLHRAEGSKAVAWLEAARAAWAQRLPGTPDALWTWCLEQDRKTLLDLLAYCAAATVNAVVTKNVRAESDQLAHATQLAAAVNLDMRAWFTPTAANYFGRVSKAEILGALREAKNAPPAPAWEKMKKSDLAALAERETAGIGWLPATLR